MKKGIGIFVIGLFLGAILTFLIGRNFVPQIPTKTSLKILGPEGKVSIDLNVEGEAIDYANIMNQIFSDDFIKLAAVAWLAEKQNIYKIDREELATAIEKKLCDPIPEEPLEARLKLGRACAEKVVASKLRKLSESRLPPFHHVGMLGKMGLPGDPDNRPSRGFSNVCKTSEFRGRKLQVSNPNNGIAIEVTATGYYECTPAMKYPDIQIGSIDANTLFPNSSISKLEQVVIIPIE